jgi:hypothetical protein
MVNPPVARMTSGARAINVSGDEAGITRTPAVVNPHGAAVDPTQLLQRV